MSVNGRGILLISQILFIMSSRIKPPRATDLRSALSKLLVLNDISHVRRLIRPRTSNKCLFNPGPFSLCHFEWHAGHSQRISFGLA